MLEADEAYMHPGANAMKAFYRCLALLALVVTGAGRSLAQNPPQGALDALLHYYSAINLREYSRAYDLWANPTQTFYNFARGFEDTRSVRAYLGTPQITTDAAVLGVPAVLIAQRTNQTQASFAGCFAMRDSASGWRIAAASFQQLTFSTGSSGAPTPEMIQSFTQVSCSATGQPLTILPIAGLTPAPANPADQALSAYFSAINDQNYTAAYAMWVTSSLVDRRPAFASFSAGYANTRAVALYPGAHIPVALTGLSAWQPVVLVGLEANGAITAYSGCYALGLLAGPDAPWGVVDGRLAVFKAGMPSAQEIAAGLAGVNCAGVGG